MWIFCDDQAVDLVFKSTQKPLIQHQIEQKNFEMQRKGKITYMVKPREIFFTIGAGIQLRTLLSFAHQNTKGKNSQGKCKNELTIPPFL